MRPVVLGQLDSTERAREAAAWEVAPEATPRGSPSCPNAFHAAPSRDLGEKANCCSSRVGAAEAASARILPAGTPEQLARLGTPGQVSAVEVVRRIVQRMADAYPTARLIHLPVRSLVRMESGSDPESARREGR